MLCGEKVMDRGTFLELEYQTLQEEIAQTKDHRFKLVGFGFIGMPSAYYLANAIDKLPDLEVLVLSFPLLICVIVLLYISESRTIMRVRHVHKGPH
jgi:hypothetical protein